MEWLFLAAVALFLGGWFVERRWRRRRTENLGAGYNAHRAVQGDHAPQSNPSDHRYQGGISQL